MFESWGRFVVRTRWAVTAGAVAVLVIGAVWGLGVFGSLTSGGFRDAHSESEQVRARINAAFGPQDADVLVVYRSSSLLMTNIPFIQAVEAKVAGLRALPQIAGVSDEYNTHTEVRAAADGHETYVIVRLRAGEDGQKLDDYHAIKPELVMHSGDITTSLAGLRPFYDDVNAETTSDVQRAEELSMPILLILLVIIFRSVVAALAPLVVGVLAVLGSFVVVRLIANVTTVSSFAINIITLIGLGLSIDYALFIVSRFREEMESGRTPAEAVVRTIATAGRTVAVSGLTVTLALGGLLLFPQSFLRSMGYGAMSAVAVAMLASLTVLPAALALLGNKVNALRVPVPTLFKRAGTGTAGSGSEAGGAWAALAHSVMRRPWLYLVGVLAILAVLAAPVTRIQFGGVDIRTLPASSPARAASDLVAHTMPSLDALPVQVLVTNEGGVDTALATLAHEIHALPGVTGTEVVAENHANGLINVSFSGLAVSAPARDLVATIRGLRTPPGTSIGVTGATADLVDQLDGLGARLPWMALYVIVVTSVLLFLAFGSVVLPVKAILMNIVSLGAAFGAVVFIFQEGHFASWLGFTPTGTIEPTNPILMIVVLFGLATDYEVFLLSRIREEWDNGAGNTASVATGLQRTGQIITSAALLLVIVVVGFATGGIAFVKLIGVGMIVAITVDATLVRALLVPAAMRLLGDWNWWVPGPLAKVYRRYGLHEAAPVPAARVPAQAIVLNDEDTPLDHQLTQ